MALDLRSLMAPSPPIQSLKEVRRAVASKRITQLEREVELLRERLDASVLTRKPATA